MKTALIVVALTAVALAQEGPAKTMAEERPSYQFSFEQGWRLGVALGTPATVVTFEELTAGLGEPQFRDTQIMQAGSIPGLNRPFDPLMRPEPIKADGRLVQEKGGFLLVLDRVEYWDLSQRWWVAFNNGTVEARNIVKERWTGKTEEWTTRLDEIEKAMLAHYVKCGAPTGKKGAAQTLGFRIDEDPGKRIFVTAAVEEQLVAILLLRLNGSRIEKGWSPDVTKRYPERVLDWARQLTGRLVAQCKGELAPAAAKSRGGRSVKRAAWEADNAAVPGFLWMQNPEWMKAFEKRIRDARTRLGDVIEGSKKSPIERTAWDRMLETELKAINGINGAVPEVVSGATAQDVLAPRMLWPGQATFDYDEKLTLKDGAVGSSRVEIAGRVKGQVTAFYDAVTHQWRVGELQVETWFKSSVTRR